MVERLFAQFLALSRWLLAPFYLALVLCLGALLVKAVQHSIEFMAHLLAASESLVITDVLKLVDLTLTASLIVIIIFSGYANFVSRIDVDTQAGWPEWMTKVDFSGLKLKLMSSIVAISAVQLLTVFMDIAETSDRDLKWSALIHVIFVVSGVLLALTDRLAGEHHRGN
jgi:uncharacterized protein (TIGR00645 family)